MTSALGYDLAHALAMSALATGDLAESRYAAAYVKLLPFVHDVASPPTATMWPDFVEAASRTGRLDEGRAVVARLEDLAADGGSRWMRGMSARSRALVAGDRTAETHFRTALAELGDTPAVIDVGRTHLLYGEWLRRSRRRRHATAQLHHAVRIFAHADAAPFTRRARRELEAAEARRTPGLTGQEATVAELAATGRTNAEIGAAMFVSPSTVDYHLRKVFQKLGITSRRQLAERLPSR